MLHCELFRTAFLVGRLGRGGRSTGLFSRLTGQGDGTESGFVAGSGQGRGDLCGAGPETAVRRVRRE